MSISTDRLSIAEAMLHLDGAKFSLRDYPFYHAYYKGNWRSTLLMCGRQVGKSVSAAGFSIVDCIAQPHFKTFYISPSLKQTSTFSNTRVGKMLRHSPRLKPFVSGNTDNVFLKILANGSELLFSYATDNPDRARGVSADRVVYDEVQNIVYSEVVPVINECLANSPYGYVSYMGTPLTMENTIQYLWDKSTKTEWVVKCESCNKRSFYRDTKGIGKEGLLCLHCGKYVDPRNGVWVDMSPDERVDETVLPKIKGFHVPQIILPANTSDPVRWARIINKMETYTESKFKNEVLGISDSLGTRLLGLEDLQKSCQGYDIPTAPGPLVTGGVDWSGGGSKGYSRTVAWVFSSTPNANEYKTVWFKIYPDSNPVDVVEDIAKNFMNCKVQLVIGDAGEGALANSLLQRKIGTVPLYQLQYCSSSTPLKWNNADRYMGDKTTLIDNYMMQLKKGFVIYPKLGLMDVVFKDMLALYEETTATGKKIWTHSPVMPDDSFHAQVFCWVAQKVLRRDLAFY